MGLCSPATLAVLPFGPVQGNSPSDPLEEGICISMLSCLNIPNNPRPLESLRSYNSTCCITSTVSKFAISSSVIG